VSNLRGALHYISIYGIFKIHVKWISYSFAMVKNIFYQDVCTDSEIFCKDFALYNVQIFFIGLLLWFELISWRSEMQIIASYFAD